MLETSTYGLSQGSLFSILGTDNTFEGAPAILGQSQGIPRLSFMGILDHFGIEIMYIRI